MNLGTFYKERTKILIFPFENKLESIPLEVVKNGMITKTEEGYYSLTKVKEKVVSLEFFRIVQNGKVVENPFDYSQSRMKTLFDEGSYHFKPIMSSDFSEPDLERLESELITLGFYRSDKYNFKRALFVHKDRKNLSDK